MQRSTLKQYSEYFLVKWLLTFKMFRLRYILKYLTIRLKNSPLAQDHNTPTFYLLFRLTIYYRSWILVDLNTIIFILSFVTFKFSVVFPFFARGQLPPLSIEMVWEVIIIVWFQTVCFALVVFLWFLFASFFGLVCFWWDCLLHYALLHYQRFWGYRRIDGLAW